MRKNDKTPEPPYFNRSDWIGVAGILIGVIGSVFFYWLSDKSRDVRMTLNPVVTQIVNKGFASNLDVKYKGQDVSDDLFAIQVAVWNSGKEPVRREDILNEVVIVAPKGLQVLEARVTSTTRPEIAFEVRDGSPDNTKYRLDWRILEKNDGALVQLLCRGDKNLSPRLVGTIVGQGTLRSGTSRPLLNIEKNVLSGSGIGRLDAFSALPFIGFGGFSLLLGLLSRRLRRSTDALNLVGGSKLDLGDGSYVLVVGGLFFVLIGMLFLYFAAIESPFGF